MKELGISKAVEYGRQTFPGVFFFLQPFPPPNSLENPPSPCYTKAMQAMQLIYFFIPFLIALAIGIVAFQIALNAARPIWPVTLWREKDKKSPVKQNLLNYPGKTLANKIDDLVFDLMPWGLALIGGPAAVWYLYAFLTPRPVTMLPFILLIVSTLVATGAGCVALARRFRYIRHLRLGLDAERATAEELNQLMRHGFHVFHDFPADNFNIDHIVIGPTGVFAVETKSRPPLLGKGLEGATVKQDGGTLRFPTHVDRDSIPQAAAQAHWLEKFLKDSIHKQIRVRAILALPGWGIKREPHDEKVLVLNPLNSTHFFINGPTLLDEQTITDIVKVISKSCRTITPFDPY